VYGNVIQCRISNSNFRGRELVGWDPPQIVILVLKSPHCLVGGDNQAVWVFLLFHRVMINARFSKTEFSSNNYIRPIPIHRVRTVKWIVRITNLRCIF
jgi:hypothetical protein